MRIRLAAVTVLALAAALAAVAVTRAAGVTISASVAGGSALSVASLNAPSFALTLTGDDLTTSYQAQLQVVDARGLATGGGWNLTVGATQFSDGAGHTLPTTADTITGVTAICHSGSTCTAPGNSVANTSLAMPLSPSTIKFLNAATDTGLGRIDLTTTVRVVVPANTIAAAYSSTLTVAVAAGP